MSLFFKLIILLSIGQLYVDGYKPVVIVHGIFDHRDSLFSLMDRIEEKHPGTNVTIVDKLHGIKSMSPMWYQVKVFKKIIQPIMEENPDGIHIIGYSQGGLVARALIESMNDHNVQTFISLSSPQGGQYGDQFLKLLFPSYVKEKVWKIFYRKSGQLLSVGNYWRDPHHLDAFYSNSIFLPVIDNNTPDQSQVNTDFKNNFMRLKRIIMIGGPQDGVISPWQSSHFACYDESEEVVGIKQREIYKDDAFGLRTLDEENKVLRVTIEGVAHLQWHRNITVIDNNIIPFLD